jgi:hypothetical protein
MNATIWSGTAASAVNLHNFLPANFTMSSYATAIWHSGPYTYVLGYGFNNTTGRNEALLWKRLPVTAYCSAKVNSLGCTPSMSAQGTPSASSSNTFYVRSSNMQNNKVGVLFYGSSGRSSAPFSGGTLCVNPPLKRVSGLNSGGNNPPINNCSGEFLVDMNAFRSGTLGGTPASYLSVPGVVVNCQYWGRDSGFTPPNNTQLSNGLEFEIGP